MAVNNYKMFWKCYQLMRNSTSSAMAFSDAAKPLLRASQLCGLAPYSVTKYSRSSTFSVSKPLIFFTIILCVVIHTALILLSPATENMSRQFSAVISFTTIVEALISAAIFLSSHIGCVLNRHQKADMLNEMSKICDIFDNKFSRYSWLSVLQMSMMIMGHALTFGSSVLLWHLNKEIIPSMFIAWFVEISKKIYDLHFIDSIFVLSKLYTLYIFKLLDFEKSLKVQQPNHSRVLCISESILRSSSFGKNSFQEPFDVSRKLHSRLYELANSVSSMYGVHNLLSITLVFVHLVQSIYLKSAELLGMTGEAKDNTLMSITLLLDTTVRFGQLMMMVYACNSLKNQANELAYVVSKLQTTSKSVHTRSLMDRFSAQLVHRRVDITACGLFPIDASLIYSIVGAVTTYIVILIQFRQSSDPDKNH